MQSCLLAQKCSSGLPPYCPCISLLLSDRVAPPIPPQPSSPLPPLPIHPSHCCRYPAYGTWVVVGWGSGQAAPCRWVSTTGFAFRSLCFPPCAWFLCVPKNPLCCHLLAGPYLGPRRHICSHTHTLTHTRARAGAQRSGDTARLPRVRVGYPHERGYEHGRPPKSFGGKPPRCSDGSWRQTPPF